MKENNSHERADLILAAMEKLSVDEIWVKEKGQLVYDEVRRKECLQFTEALMEFLVHLLSTVPSEGVPGCLKGLAEFEEACKQYLTPLPPVVNWEWRKGSYEGEAMQWVAVVIRQAE